MHNTTSIFISMLLVMICAGKSPNIMFIMMDDLGWNDISAQGGQFPTPAIDALYTSSIRLNRHYIHLMCSPSRSQFITGRYAMHMGFGKMLPWDYTEIGGIPIGQPTIANWLRDYGNYDTYALGKWHMGYAYKGMTPLQRGFNHFYGFYQGAIHYDTKKYIDIRFGDSDHFDFWEGENPAMGGELNTTTNTMYYYRDKIVDYLQDYYYESDEHPFYMYVALQTIHGPLKRVLEFTKQCDDILGGNVPRRTKYCMNTLLADSVIGSIVDELVGLGLYDNTLIVLTTDNGADIANKGCNYPLRGTKGTMFDGNLRTVALISGGIIPASEYNTMRTSLFSSLDWTPTLLHFSGLLSDISTDDYSWDGIDQYSLIMHGDDAVADAEKRSEIILNIGLRSLQSASIVFEYNNNLYKYFARNDTIDSWAYKRVDGWCEPSSDGSSKWNIILDDEESMSAAQDYDNKYLFDLIADEREMNNMLLTHQSTEISSIISYAHSIMRPFLMNGDLFSEHIACLWNRLPVGIPSKIGENSFIRPFLSKIAYFKHLETCFANEVKNGNPISDELQALYYYEWIAPQHLVAETNKNLYFQRFVIEDDKQLGHDIPSLDHKDSEQANIAGNAKLIADEKEMEREEEEHLKALQVLIWVSVVVLIFLVCYCVYQSILHCSKRKFNKTEQNSNIFYYQQHRGQCRDRRDETVCQSLLESSIASSEFYDIPERVHNHQYGYGTLENNQNNALYSMY